MVFRFQSSALASRCVIWFLEARCKVRLLLFRLISLIVLLEFQNSRELLFAVPESARRKSHLPVIRALGGPIVLDAPNPSPNSVSIGVLS